MKSTKEIITLSSYLSEVNINDNKFTYTSNSNRLDLINAINTKKTFIGLVTKCNIDGDLTLDVNGTTCYMKRNDVSMLNNDQVEVHKRLCQRKVGTYLRVSVKNIDNLNTNDEKIYVTRKELISAARKEYSENIKIGSIIEGKIFNIDENKGVFVDIGADIMAVIPRSKLENLYVSNISDHVSIGEKIQAVVIDLIKDENNNNEKIFMDRRILLPKFNELVKDYSKGDVVVGKVKAIGSTGIYCSINKHLDILCDFTPGTLYSVDDKVQVKIRFIKYDKQRVSGDIISKL